MTDCVKFTASLPFQLYLTSLSFASLETVKGYPQDFIDDRTNFI